jgi:hypothetical protein
MKNPVLQAHAIQYAELCGISLNLKTPLGYGNDGIVWRSDRQSAVTVFEQRFKYDRESACYQRLAENNVKSIEGLAVPQLMGVNEDLMIVEMRLVTPPYLLDFGKAYLDTSPEYPVESMEEWEAEGAENFGARWSDVKVILWRLKQYGIYLRRQAREHQLWRSGRPIMLP